MSRGRSTAVRYKADNGPVVFGIPGLNVRWNRETRCVVLECDDGSGASWAETGDLAELMIVALAASHRQGRMRETVRAMLDGYRISLSLGGEFYRCGKLMCWKPTWQEIAR